MIKKLGRGLDSLIADARPETEGAPTEIPVGQVRPNPFQPREEFDEAALDELCASIREHGVLQPILVRPAGEGYELVAGERRWQASRTLGLEEIPAVIREIPDDRMLEIALVENLQREDLNPIEKARAYRRYLDELDLTHEAAAQRLGKDRSTVTNQLRLLELSDDLQALVSRGTLSMGHARALLGTPDEERRRVIARRIVSDGMSVRATEKAVKDGRPKQAREKKEPAPRPVWADDYERRLRERFATKVRIDGGSERGRITLEYYTRAELERLLETLTGE